MRKKETVEVLVYEDTDKQGVNWVAFTPIAFDAFKLWLQSVALSSKAKVRFKRRKLVVSFRRATRGHKKS